MSLTILLVVMALVLPPCGLETKAGGINGSPTFPSSESKSVRPFSRDASAEALKWANRELRRMSLNEKVGQLVSIAVSPTFLNQNSDAFHALRHQVIENHVGGITLFRGPVYESVVLMNRLQQLARYPLLISSDLEAGSGMRFEDTITFPWNMAVAATTNPDYARRQGEVTALEARAMGVQQIYAPVVDVNNNAANPVINVRSYGEDATEVARFAVAFTAGVQSRGVIATAKHFPGHGDTAIDSHSGLPQIDVDRERLDAVELVPFKATVSSGVGAVMVGHIGLPRIEPSAINPLAEIAETKSRAVEDHTIARTATLPATLSPTIGGILRNDLKFNGMMVTDALNMRALTIYFTQEEIAVRALEAGTDILLMPADHQAALVGVLRAVQSGRLTEKRIEDSARKILAAKYDLGLVKHRLTALEAIDQIVADRGTSALANEIAERAITLVRNDQKLVPLTHLKTDGRILNLAITDADERPSITNAFRSAVRNSGRTMETVVLSDNSSDAEVENVLKRAASADVVVASFYLRARSDRGRSLSSAPGGRVLLTLLAKAVPVIGISFGSPYLLLDLPGLRAYMVSYGEMPSLQQAAARALLGEIEITGRLPVSLPGLYPRGTGIQLTGKGNRDMGPR